MLKLKRMFSLSLVFFFLFFSLSFPISQGTSSMYSLTLSFGFFSLFFFYIIIIFFNRRGLIINYNYPSRWKNFLVFYFYFYFNFAGGLNYFSTFPQSESALFSLPHRLKLRVWRVIFFWGWEFGISHGGLATHRTRVCLVDLSSV